MLKTLLAHRFGFARALGIIAGLLAFFCFEDLFHFIWYVSLPIGVVPNGRIYGIVRTIDGQPARFAHVALMDAPLPLTGGDGYHEEVDADAEGRFVITGVPPGIYALGRLRANVDGVVYPSVYYPGTLDRATATSIVVGRSTEHDVGEFVVPRRSGDR